MNTKITSDTLNKTTYFLITTGNNTASSDRDIDTANKTTYTYGTCAAQQNLQLTTNKPIERREVTVPIPLDPPLKDVECEDFCLEIHSRPALLIILSTVCVSVLALFIALLCLLERAANLV